MLHTIFRRELFRCLLILMNAWSEWNSTSPQQHFMFHHITHVLANGIAISASIHDTRPLHVTALYLCMWHNTFVYHTTHIYVTECKYTSPYIKQCHCMWVTTIDCESMPTVPYPGCQCSHSTHSMQRHQHPEKCQHSPPNVQLEFTRPRP